MKSNFEEIGQTLQFPGQAHHIVRNTGSLEAGMAAMFGHLGHLFHILGDFPGCYALFLEGVMMSATACITRADAD